MSTDSADDDTAQQPTAGLANRTRGAGHGGTRRVAQADRQIDRRCNQPISDADSSRASEGMSSRTNGQPSCSSSINERSNPPTRCL